MTFPTVRGVHVFCLLFILMVTSILPVTARTQSYSFRTVDTNNLRQIGQATLIYASVHDEKLPEAENVWDYARILAESAGLEDARFWLSTIDPASDSNHRKKIDVLLPAKPGRPRQLNPEFLATKPALAVALGKLDVSMPSTTPIAWTRGLQPDGTWAAHSPYGRYGGHIVFLGGNIQFFHNLTDGGGELMRFDGKGPTANIIEALPPGTRIGEYTPTPEEQVAWANVERKLSRPYSPGQPWIPLLLVIWLPYLAVSVYRLKKRSSGAFTVLIWPALFTLLLLPIIVPTV